MAQGTAEPAIELAGVQHSYGTAPVLRGLDLSVQRGEIYALLGGNGAGKSTTLSALLGFIAPSSGSVRVCGIDPVSDPRGARAQMAYVPENVSLYDHLTARENIAYFLALAGHDTGASVIEPALGAVGLDSQAWDRRMSGFSKGMRQKVAIALALARDVPVLLLDEPTSGLDPRAVLEFNGLLDTARERQVAVLMVTHDLVSAVDIADRIGFLTAGRIEEEQQAGEGARFDLNALHDRYAGTGQAI
ncbi:ABC transporter ATP-binding protein [Altericroceibacterium endophyticum]|uniref:ATP-binding cassette domain-containing protein n=1 Tax=Altericroceibacterium endophyticum TaxID=1808508 RepID=A0A6I4T7Y0_9SPHN|nr:ABC transporter ATP-binding protein [Altericroceibacterium endophyticum]MXO66211.1 ATP-binding cassette domain-containing protein [Altericroceibacterium endophyticum]